MNSFLLDNSLLEPSDCPVIQVRNKSNGIMEYVTQNSFRKSLDLKKKESGWSIKSGFRESANFQRQQSKKAAAKDFLSSTPYRATSNTCEKETKETQATICQSPFDSLEQFSDQISSMSSTIYSARYTKKDFFDQKPTIAAKKSIEIREHDDEANNKNNENLSKTQAVFHITPLQNVAPNSARISYDFKYNVEQTQFSGLNPVEEQIQSEEDIETITPIKRTIKKQDYKKKVPPLFNRERFISLLDNKPMKIDKEHYGKLSTYFDRINDVLPQRKLNDSMMDIKNNNSHNNSQENLHYEDNSRNFNKKASNIMIIENEQINKSSIDAQRSQQNIKYELAEPKGSCQKLKENDPRDKFLNFLINIEQQVSNTSLSPPQKQFVNSMELENQQIEDETVHFRQTIDDKTNLKSQQSLDNQEVFESQKNFQVAQQNLNTINQSYMNSKNNLNLSSVNEDKNPSPRLEVIDEKFYSSSCNNYSNMNTESEEKRFSKPSKNQQCYSIDPALLEDFNINDPQIQYLIQDQFINNKIDIEKIIEKNVDYFFHLMGFCACVQCICGQCSCQYHFGPQKLYQNGFSTYYKKEFIEKKRYQNVPPLNNSHYENLHEPYLEQTSWGNTNISTNRRDFIEPPLQPRFKRKYTRLRDNPLFGLSSYKATYIDYKDYDSGKIIHSPENIQSTVGASFPLNATTNYDKVYNKHLNPIENLNADDVKRLQQHDIIPDLYREKKISNYEERYTKINQEQNINRPLPYKKISELEKPQTIPVFEGQYKSTNEAYLEGKQKNPCPGTLKVDYNELLKNQFLAQVKELKHQAQKIVQERDQKYY